MRHEQDVGSNQSSGNHTLAEHCEGPFADTSPDVNHDDNARAAWQPYVRMAEVQSMDLDAICMPRR